jgi:hypothetical protein
MFALLATFLPIFLYAQVLLSTPKERVLATREISLQDRYPNRSVNEVFKENILLNLAYMRGLTRAGTTVDWDQVTKPFSYKMTLRPGETFAFHDDVLPSYKSNALKTTNAHFNSQEGFKSDGYLVGDGVCHLASLMYWASKSAGLASLAPTNHNFANIPEVPKEYGVSIYAAPGDSSDQRQNLYIKNDKTKPIAFVFSYENNVLKVDVKEIL